MFSEKFSKFSKNIFSSLVSNRLIFYNSQKVYKNVISPLVK